MSTRAHNEKKFGQWDEPPGGIGITHRDVPGRPGWLARYFKELDANERTLRFGQAVHEDQGKPVEIHEKYPVDKATGNCRIPP